jgi:hypothetical protein
VTQSKALIVLVVAVLGASAPGAAAATKTRVEKPTSTSSFNLRGSNGFWVEVSADHAQGEKKAKVMVKAVTERYKVEMQSTAYSTRTRLNADGGFDAKLPGLGRIDVSFEQKKAHRVRIADGPHCNDRSQLIRKGVFRGRISFRGERGFTAVHAKSAPGTILERDRLVCHEPEYGVPGITEPGGPEMPPGTYNPAVFASRPGTSFWAAGPPATEPPVASGGIPVVAFEATYSTARRGIQIFARASVDSGSNRFLVPGPLGALTDATVEPPAPFKGSGTYHLESPTTATWSGDLRVEFPGIGSVPLTGPGFAARLCEGFHCTGAAAPSGASAG